MKLSYRPFTFNSYKAFLKNKSGFGKTLCFIFYKMFEKNYLLYSITWPLTSNFHHPVKKIILPTKFHFNPHWGNFYNMLFFSFEWSKSLFLRFPPPHKNSHLLMSRYPTVSHRCWEHGGLESTHGGGWGGVNMLLKNICKGVHMLVMLLAISLQIY